MGHRDVPGTFWPGHNQHDQNSSHNNDVQQHLHFGCGGVSDHQVAYPVGNRLIGQGPVLPNWNHSTVSNRYSYTHHDNDFQHHQFNVAPLNHSYPSLPAVPAFSRSHVQPSSSSNNNPSGFYRNEPTYGDLTMGGRRSSKRKSSAIPFGGERESTNRFLGAGSSSCGHRYPDFVQENPNLNSARHWEHHAMYTGSYGSHSRPVGAGWATRNVRRRYACDVESGLIVPGSFQQFARPVIHPNCHSSSLDPTYWTSSGVNPSWRHSHMPSGAPGMIPVAGLSNSNQWNNPTYCGSTATNFSSEAGYQNHFHGTRNLFGHQNSSENFTRPMQVVHSFSQQCPESYRNIHNPSGVGPSHDYPRMVSANYSSTSHRRPFHRDVFVPTGRNGRRIGQERCRFLPGDISGLDGPISEGLMAWDQSAMEGFRDMFDQHGDMRLDVDDMTYEELLALGERIGNVCTGLSDDEVSKCLVEAVRGSSSDEELDEETCVICLEEYKNMEIVGEVRGCGHGYHSLCIKKWLSMKNSCPICKAPADSIDDKGEKKQC